MFYELACIISAQGEINPQHSILRGKKMCVYTSSVGSWELAGEDLRQTLR